MDAARRFADADHLTDLVKAAFGTDRRIDDLQRLPNGSKKGVYRLRLDDATRAVVYIWDPAEDYWHDVLPDGATDPADPFSHASGLDLFQAASIRLADLDVRSPAVLLADRSRTLYPADIAIVEDVTGGTLEHFLEHEPDAATASLDMLAESLRRMHGHQAPAFGKVGFVDSGGRSTRTTCEQVVLDRALTQVTEAANKDPRAATGRDALNDMLHTLAARISPRSRIGLIHGELGPDHVLIDPDGTPVLIDIEGLMYFDIEWEHAWTRMRFDRHYNRLRRDDLDQHRLHLYQLAMHIDLVAGPLRIAASDHPERQWFLDLADFHLRKALEFQL
ncbi:phosphotransferase [Catenulispora yoronensis]|uniref:Phosphotransferase n=1 Tax=Catenulispora yoronensis TaxID=450799 RepID=A0ABP5GA30_9ACTN